MKKLLFPVVLALVAGLAPAQISGSINRNAAKVSQSIAMGDNKLEVNYTAIRFGKGQWQQLRENAQAHERFNANAERRPLGAVKTSVAVTAAGKQVPAGEYAMYFTLHEQAGWILNLKSAAGGEPIRWRMALQQTEHKSDCMLISLTPSAEDGKCSLSVSFGDQYVTVPVTVGAAEAKPADADKEGSDKEGK